MKRKFLKSKRFLLLIKTSFLKKKLVCQSCCTAFRRASAVCAAATGLTEARVSNVGESVIRQSVPAAAVLSHSAADRHKQAHASTHTHTHTERSNFPHRQIPLT